MIAVGQIAPDFDLASSSGGSVKLSGLKGRPVVLYFYPEANTPGCRTETKAFRDLTPGLAAKGVQVLGISVDDVAKQKKFSDDCGGLAFPLLADTEKSVARAYGVLNVFGKAKRVTFFIGPDGVVADVVEASSPNPHVERARQRFLSAP
jgi:peroxiredoxin Q/BCP